MEHDLDLMDQTENLVAEMLKSAMGGGANVNHKLPNGTDVDDSIQCIFMNGSAENLKEKHENTFDDPDVVFICEETTEVLEQAEEVEESDNFDSSELDAFIADGLYKIRTEYPMRPDPRDFYSFANMHDGPTPIMAACPNANLASPYHIWYGVKPTNYGDFWPIYQENSDSNLGGEQQYWNEPADSRNGSDTSLQWSYLNQSVSATNFNGEENAAVPPNDDDYDDAQPVSDEENFSIIESNTLPEEEQPHGFNRNEGISEPQPCRNENFISPSSVPDEESSLAAAAVAAAAIHAEQTTTTTTTTAAGFGLLHQQTSSCTTTNFIQNGLANAVLANSTTAALYAQSILTSTAHQYLSVFRKEVQQYLSSINYSAMSMQNLNLGFYERLFLAQLLAQQLVYQQQQQIALAALIQQQKLAAQMSTNFAAASTTTFLTPNSTPNPNVNVNVNCFSPVAPPPPPPRSGANNMNNVSNVNSVNNVTTCNGYGHRFESAANDCQAIITEEYLGTSTHKPNSE